MIRVNVYGFSPKKIQKIEETANKNAKMEYLEPIV
jgi:hypothetical protein